MLISLDVGLGDIRSHPPSNAARQPLQYLAPGFTANRGAAARAVSQARNVLGDDRFTQAQKEGQALTLDDAVAYATRKAAAANDPPPAGPASPRPNWTWSG